MEFCFKKNQMAVPPKSEMITALCKIHLGKHWKKDANFLYLENFKFKEPS